MRIIADCGSSKTEWAVVEGGGNRRVVTRGCNAAMARPGEIAEMAREVDVERGRVERVEFYGAGCGSEAVCERVARELSGVFSNADVEVASDMLAAARGVCGNRAGIVCILGTGANSCFYDGVRIVKNHPALGFILGDEGSGAVLGRRLIGDYFKQEMPEHVAELFRREYPQLTQAEAIERVYRTERPSAWLAGFVPFLGKYRGEEYVESLLADEFGRFVKRNLTHYEEYGCEEVSFVGSVAYYFREELSRVCEGAGFSIGRILKAPMDGLV